ncbi:hypothetical protein [Planomonospora parontospora]|nr:hypothetical protein [Planomonospora parontospora]GGL14232.1 hypothetical protein GCM10014719_15280 [Planomonospora parontospora subsp. antibiotica]GII17856.1 hypothetical protein Ppa05_45820 [Planomonospora parontospora subsp. antibiotica]
MGRPARVEGVLRRQAGDDEDGAVTAGFFRDPAAALGIDYSGPPDA